MTKMGNKSINLNFGFQLEREISESTSSLRRSKERVSELEQRVSYMEKVKFLTDDLPYFSFFSYQLTFSISFFDE